MLTELTDIISHLVLSSDGTYVVAADLNSNIAIWAKGEVREIKKFNSLGGVSIDENVDNNENI